jgi:hypothetical protein
VLKIIDFARFYLNHALQPKRARVGERDRRNQALDYPRKLRKQTPSQMFVGGQISGVVGANLATHNLSLVVLPPA